jgi:hypothetical protein
MLVQLVHKVAQEALVLKVKKVKRVLTVQQVHKVVVQVLVKMMKKSKNVQMKDLKMSKVELQML